VASDSDKSPPLPANGLYPIRTVSAATGVPSVTLRAWERRYGLLEPRRTAKGHRLYTSDQIEKVRQVVQLLDQGIAISQVKPLLETPPDPSLADHGSPSVDRWQTQREDLKQAIERFDAAALDRLYDQALAVHRADTVMDRLTLPVLEALGARWKVEPAGIAQEHFYHAYLRNRIGARFHHSPAPESGPCLVAACMEGERHETGLLLFCLAAAARGFRVVYLGADLPLDQLPAAAAQARADAVVLSAVSRPRAALLSVGLPKLAESLSVPLFFGGPATLNHERLIAATGAIPLGTEHDAALDRIRALL